MSLSSNQLQMLPTYKYKERHYQKSDAVDERCAICLTMYESGSDVKLLPCLHSFHKKCIDEWLQVSYPLIYAVRGFLTSVKLNNSFSWVPTFSMVILDVLGPKHLHSKIYGGCSHPKPPVQKALLIQVGTLCNDSTTMTYNSRRSGRVLVCACLSSRPRFGSIAPRPNRNQTRHVKYYIVELARSSLVESDRGTF